MALAMRLLTALFSVTEKAATLARLVHSEKELFDLLIEENMKICNAF